jgi:D-glycero-D-manno-heptose 1,7-bisphosphate phosphatase
MNAAAVFFDRDGIVNRVPDGVYYVTRAADFHITPAFWDALAVVRQQGYRAVIATNQKGVATGATPPDELARLHQQLLDEAQARGLVIDGIYTCPHAGGCDCRKPKPGLLLRAARDLHLDLSRSWMIGDKPRDCEAGRAAGCPHTLLVSATESSPFATHRVDRMEEVPTFLAQHAPLPSPLPSA